MNEILQEEEDLSEIVQLVGKASLPETARPQNNSNLHFGEESIREISLQCVNYSHPLWFNPKIQLELVPSMLQRVFQGYQIQEISVRPEN